MRKMALAVVLVGIIGIIIGGIFIYQGLSKENMMKEIMRSEKVTLGIDKGNIAKGDLIDTMEELMLAGNTVREHRHKIAPTYGDLLGGKKYDPTNIDQLTYSQAINLENYIYLGVLSFGVTQIAQASGVFMVLMGLVLVFLGGVQYRKEGKPA
jgi:hypothetical protein